MDKILSCTKVIENGVLIQYDIEYSITNGDKTNTFCVVVLANELSSPDDVNEAKNIANTKASQIKAKWLLNLPSQEPLTIGEVVGTVALE